MHVQNDFETYRDIAIFPRFRESRHVRNCFYYYRLIFIITIKRLKVVDRVDYIKPRIYDAFVRLTQSPCICHYVNITTLCVCVRSPADCYRVDRRRLSILSLFYRLDTPMAATRWTFIFTYGVLFLFHRFCRYLYYYYSDDTLLVKDEGCWTFYEKEPIGWIFTKERHLYAILMFSIIICVPSYLRNIYLDIRSVDIRLCRKTI